MPADRFMRRLLRIRGEAPTRREEDTYGLFSVSIVISALRCLLTYIILPVFAPLIGKASGVGPAVGIPLAVVALYFDVRGIRRFWLANHRWRWAMTGVYALVMAFVLALLAGNIADIV